MIVRAIMTITVEINAVGPDDNVRALVNPYKPLLHLRTLGRRPDRVRTTLFGTGWALRLAPDPFGRAIWTAL
jgi:hypothetical protein